MLQTARPTPFQHRGLSAGFNWMIGDEKFVLISWIYFGLKVGFAIIDAFVETLIVRVG